MEDRLNKSQEYDTIRNLAFKNWQLKQYLENKKAILKITKMKKNKDESDNHLKSVQ